MTTSGEIDPVKAMALTLAAVDHMEPEQRSALAPRALRQLVKAVRRDAERRGSCRDVDVSAATRVRPWRLG